jgi:hypothetical protein
MTPLSTPLQKSSKAKLIGLTLAGLLMSAGSLHAQSCAQQSEGDTTCRLMLSEPRAFTVEAHAKLVGRPAKAPKMIIAVNGQPCRGPRYETRSFSWGRCLIKFPADGSVIEAKVEGQDVHTPGVAITLTPNDRLAAVPQDARDLYPKGRRDGFLSNFWPFPR